MISRILAILLYIKTAKLFPQHISAHKQPKLGRSRLYSFPAFLITAMGKNVEVAIFPKPCRLENHVSQYL